MFESMLSIPELATIAIVTYTIGVVIAWTLAPAKGGRS